VYNRSDYMLILLLSLTNLHVKCLLHSNTTFFGSIATSDSCT